MRKVFKVLLYVILAIILIVVGVFVAINTPWGKDQIRIQAVRFLEKKLDTKVAIGKIDFSIPNSVNLSKVLLLDKRQDTVVWVKQLDVDINMLKLIQGKISISKLNIENADVNMYRTANDTNFNYQFVVDSFTGKKEATTQEVIDTAQKSPIYLDAGLITISDTRFRFNDTIGGALFGVRVTSLNLKPRTIDLNKMRFEVEDLSIDSAQSYFFSTYSKLPPPPPDTSELQDIEIIVDKLKLARTNFNLHDATSGMYFNIATKELSGAMPWFSLLNKKIKIEYLNLDKTNSSIVYEKPTELPDKIAEVTPSPKTAVVDTGNQWSIIVNNILLKDIAFAFDDNTKPRKGPGIDYSHMSYRNFYFNASSLKYTVDTISGIVKNISLTEKSGLNIQALRTNFIYHQQGAVLDDLFLKTPTTLIQDKIAVSYKSLAILEKDISKMKLDVALKQSVVSFKDMFIFMPAQQQQQLRDYKNQNVRFTLFANGTVDALNIRRLLLQGLHNTSVDLYGKIFGLPNTDKLTYDLYVNNLKSTERDIRAFVPASVRKSVNIPTWFAMSGRIKGNTWQYSPDMYIRTSDGNAKVTGLLSMAKKGQETYNLNIAAQDFNIGKILRMEDQLGKVTLNAKVIGSGFDPQHMNAKIDAKVAQAFYNGYNYTNVIANGFIKGKRGEFDVVSRDPNAFLNMHASLDFSHKEPKILADMRVDKLNLKALRFLDYDFDFTGDVKANVISTNPDYPKAVISVNHPFVTANGTTYMLDSIYIYSNPSNGFQDIDVNVANIIIAKLTGKIPLTKMGDAALAHINKYYKISDKVSTAPLSYDMNLEGSVSYHRLFRQIVPDLRPFDTVRFYALIDPRSLNAGLTAPGIRYKDIRLDTFALSAVEQNNSLMYVASLNRFLKKDIEFFNSSVSGFVRQDTISTFANLTDRAGRDRFSLGLLTTHDQANNRMFMLEKGLKINYDNWTVNPDNRTIWGGGKNFYVNNLFLSQGNQSIRVHSREQAYLSPFDVSIKNLLISNITKMISKDTALADGVLFVDANIDLRDSFPKLLADLRVDSLTFKKSNMGNLTAHVKNENAYSYFTNALLKGNGNNVAINGNYNVVPVNGNQLDFKAQVQPLGLKTIEGLTGGNLKNSSGVLKGDLDIRGTVDAPLISGVLNTDSLKTTLSSFNTYMFMPDENIRFVSGQGLLFDNFKIYDQYHRLATLNGRMNTKDFVAYNLGMRFYANNWQAMNSTQKNNESIYGKLFISANLGLTGNMFAPAISGDIVVHDSTNMSYALLDNPGMVSNEGIVMFYDGRDTTISDSINRALDRAKYLLSQSSSLNVNIDINKKAQFTVLLDPETGDRLNVSGTSFLNANLGPDGSMALTGTYELEDGYYEMNYNFIKKKFKIQKGSMIQLAGDPLDAEVNITAKYDAIAAPFDLVQKQAQESSELNYFRQRMPFEVVLTLSGNILKPKIGFDIVVKEGGLNTVNPSVKSFVEMKLNEMRNNPSDMNKQVVSLLLLDRFVSEDPFSSSSGVGFEYAVRQSASRFLSDQMNRLAGDLIEGLELNLGLNSSEDYSTGAKVNRTDLSIMASKRMFNDRLKLTIGNDFALEGQSNVAHTSYIPGTISADYLLTPDGRYILRGYRKSELQNIVNGYVVETGLSFRLAIEYNRFMSLFMSREAYRSYLRRKRLEEERKYLEQKESLEKNKTTNTVSKK